MGAPEQVQAAIHVLQGHHSGSVLPGRAQALLNSQAEMAQTTNGPWKCSHCRQNVKAQAQYCGKCGGHWSTSQEVAPYYHWERPAPPWQDSQSQRWKSPRRKNAHSPRRPGNGKGKGKEKGGKDGQSGKDGHRPEGKGKQQGHPPPLSALPAPPTSTVVACPKTTTTTSQSQPSPEKQQLEALVQSLSKVRESIPMETKALLDSMQKDDAQVAAKSLHRAVAAQANAKQHLAKVRAEREQYLGAWLTYIEQVTDMMDKQLSEQEAVLDGYAEAEIQWAQALQTATTDLNRLVADAPPGTAEQEEATIEESEAMVVSAVETENRMAVEKEQYRASAAMLKGALATVRAKAAERVESAKRDGSRTPRRKKPAVVDLRDEEEDKAPAAAPPGGASA